MPPLYPFFLYLLNFLNPLPSHFVDVVLYVHLTLSLIAIIYFNQILQIFYSKKISLIGTAIFALFPLYIYSCSQISSISLQIFLSILFFYNLLKFIKLDHKKNLYGFSFFSSLLILLRGEFILIFLFTLILIYIIKKKITVILISSLFTILILSPYLIRNYIVFDKITITKSIGFNLWKGNNIYSKSEGSEKIYKESMSQKIDNLQLTNKYDLEIDKIYMDEGINNIVSDPVKYLKLYFVKMFSFLFVDLNSSYPNYYNLIHIIPKILMGGLSILSLFLLVQKKSIINYFSFYLIFNIGLFSAFFILPRYSLMILPVQIIMSCELLKYLNFKSRN